MLNQNWLGNIDVVASKYWLKFDFSMYISPKGDRFLHQVKVRSPVFLVVFFANDRFCSLYRFSTCVIILLARIPRTWANGFFDSFHIRYVMKNNRVKKFHTTLNYFVDDDRFNFFPFSIPKSKSSLGEMRNVTYAAWHY